MSGHRLLRSTSVISAMTFLSRVSGLVRDQVYAHVFGAGGAMDAFFVAFRVPNFMRRLSAEGSFSMAFVPVLAQYREKHTHAEVKQLVHPKGRFLVKIGGRPVSESVVLSVSGFIALWMLCFILLVLAMNATGLDILTSFGAAIATLTNLGPGLGEVSTTFATVNATAVWLGTFGMLLGRLEVFSVLVLLTPSFWRE